MTSPGRKHLVIVSVLALCLTPLALGVTQPSRMVSANGVTLRIPAGWDGAVARRPDCDPERLIVVSSAPLQISASGQVQAPRQRQVVILLLEDRYVQDRPVGDLRRPTHFAIAWNKLVRLEPNRYCGNPNAPAAMHYFKTHGRYLGFIVYPGAAVDAQTRATTLAVMDGLRAGA
jgi:hypothetical protein